MVSMIKEASTTVSLAELFRQRRRDRGLTQQQLADLSTVGVRTIRDIESGMTLVPRPVTLELLAEVLRMDGARWRELLGDVGRTEGQPAPRPRRRTELLSRSVELQTVDRWLADGRDPRGGALALVGFPGSGKSALAWAAQARAGGSGWMTLWSAHGGEVCSSSRRATAMLGPATAELLAPGARLGPALAALCRLIGPLPTWWVLDEPGPGLPVERLALLQRRCPGLRFAYTADQPLGLPGEQVLTVEPLVTSSMTVPADPDADPDPADPATAGTATAGTDADVLRLLRAESAQTWDEQDLTAAREVCDLVDGLPRVLSLLSPLVALHGPRMVHECLSMDLLGFLATLPGEASGPDLAPRVRRTIGALDPEVRQLMDVLATRITGPVTADTLAREVGAHLWSCLRGLDQLYQRGLVRRDAHCRFHLLNHVRELVRHDRPACPTTTEPRN